MVRNQAMVKVTSGIPQGSVIGQLLLLVFINDLPDTIISLIKLSADDTKLLSRIHTLQDCDRLQADLTRLQVLTKHWILLFNASKCKVLRIGHNQPAPTYTITMKDGQ